MDDRRQEIFDSIPRSYSALAHITFTVGTGLAVLAVALFWGIHDLVWQELLVVPAMLVISNFGEHHAHRRLLHRRVPGFTILYDQHTPRHHVIYTAGDMAIRAARELKLVLIPAFGVGLITVSVSPFAIGAALLLSPNAGWLVLTGTALYVVTYEVTHLLYHLPTDHFLTRNRVVRFLREHHRRHHHPKLMKRYNFNVTFPLADIVFGTRVTDAEYARLTGEGAEPLAEPARQQAAPRAS
jgi:sterol desaturase/sphingolipid hydroxylase (fatty acid hydroxylase superfamily)